eukprot:1509994-Pleurochrysis_carterae.AAC.2
MKNKGEANATMAEMKLRQRRLIQQRIRRWQRTGKVTCDDKDRKKYRHKIRASLQWLRRKVSTEAKELNIRECRNRGKTTNDKNMKRKGGAGGEVERER